MNFKKPKTEVIEDAVYAASTELDSMVYNLKQGVMHSGPSSNIDTIHYGLTQAFRKAIQSLVESTYTDQEFEEDIGIGENK
jgi:hypothetical protein